MERPEQTAKRFSYFGILDGSVAFWSYSHVSSIVDKDARFGVYSYHDEEIASCRAYRSM